MRAAIYNPYLDSLGGGERYSLAVAKFLLDRGYEVKVEWPDPSIQLKLEERFGISLEGVDFVPDVRKGDGCEICFWLSDGSIPLLRARRNFLHFQVPFHDVGGKSLLNKMKLFRITKVICNSFFTKKVIDQEFGTNSVVIYPPVSVERFKPKRKDNLIIYVGRFSELKQSKKQDVLIEAFKKFYQKGYGDYKLILAGGVEVGSNDYLSRLEKSISGYPIEIVKSPSFRNLLDLYASAKYYWAAAGYGCNEKKYPETVEHFGISLVEAMATGAIPLVYEAGGFKEIIKNGENGFFWKKPFELVNLTEKLIIDRKLSKTLSNEAITRSSDFSYEVFNSSFEKLLE